MKAAWFLILVLLIAGGWIVWRYTPVEFRVATAHHVKRNWWVPLAVLAVIGALLLGLSSVSIKTF